MQLAKSKKMLKMRFPRWDCSDYRGAPMFLHVTPSGVDGNLKRTCREYNTCREYFNVCMRNKYITNGHKGIDTSRAYVVYTHGRVHKSEAKGSQQRMLNVATKSLKIINAFERKHKWYPLTKIYPVDDDQGNIYVPSAFFLGPAKWTMSPYLFSLYTLMIRLGKNDWIDDKVSDLCNDHEKLVNKLYRLGYARRGQGGDALQLYRTVRIWDILMSNYKELFGNRTRAYNWSLDRLVNSDYHRTEGIMRLAMGSTGERGLHDKVQALKLQLAKEAKKNVEKKAVHTKRKS